MLQPRAGTNLSHPSPSLTGWAAAHLPQELRESAGRGSREPLPTAACCCPGQAQQSLQAGKQCQAGQGYVPLDAAAWERTGPGKRASHPQER